MIIRIYNFLMRLKTFNLEFILKSLFGYLKQVLQKSYKTSPDCTEKSIRSVNSSSFLASNANYVCFSALENLNAKK